jgi:hypothetical protein
MDLVFQKQLPFAARFATQAATRRAVEGASAHNPADVQLADGARQIICDGDSQSAVSAS